MKPSTTARLTAMVFCLLAPVVACGGQQREIEDNPGGLISEPLTLEPASGNKLLKALPAATTGVTVGDKLAQRNQIKFMYNGSGAAAGDVDGDGLNDLYIVSEEGPNALYRNLGSMRFEDITRSAGVAGPTESGVFSIGATFGDVDGDGDLDLLVTNWRGPNRLYINDGTGHFDDATDRSGVGYAGGSTTATLADFDRDGDLDIFVPTYRPVALQYEQGSVRLMEVNGQMMVPPELRDRVALMEGQIRELGEKDLLYRNDGTGRFEEVGASVGITGTDWGLSSSFADVDNDLWPDLYVTNDFWSADRFYHNDGDGTFTLVDPSMVQYTPMYAMGIDFGDINNDGFLDYFIGDMLSREHHYRQTQHGMLKGEGGIDRPPPPGEAAQYMRNTLHLNNRDGSWDEIAWLAGVAASEWTWSTKFADLDLDGYLDLMITNGMVRDVMDSDYTEQTDALNKSAAREKTLAFLQEYPELVTRNLVFRNNGHLGFDDVSRDWGFDLEAISFGSAVSDLDGDGDLDVVVNNLNEPATVYRNESQQPRIQVRLHGTRSNRFGVGAKVTLVAGGVTQMREMSTSGGYLSGHAPEIVFGIPGAGAVESLSVVWPSGRVQTFAAADTPDLEPSRRLTITEPSAKPLPFATATPAMPAFREVAAEAGLSYVHHESGFDDFSQEALLPRRLSTLGPGLAWSDFDVDGKMDLYVGGAAREPGGLFLNNGDGTFSDGSNLLDANAEPNEMASLWWAPGQGKRPNLLVSHNTVWRPGSEPARLLKPTGRGLAPGSWLPEGDAAGSALAAADFDGDGDLDVFLGGRVVPRSWPLPATSHLYENRDGELVDVTIEKAPGLVDLGLVGGALWSDVDADGDPDLVAATEWGPVELLRNDGGQLVRATEAAHLAGTTGLWNGVTSADLDGDGDFDLVATNLGENSKYTASPDHPAVVYAGDVDDDGNVEVIEAEWVGDSLYPIRERGATGRYMPFVLSAFDTYRAFGRATLEAIYGNRLDQAQRFEATTLSHTVFLNDGHGAFTARPLPIAAQISTAFGVSAADFDLNGTVDLYLATNFRGADHETGPYGAANGIYLANRGDATFDVVAPDTTGLHLPEEGRGTAVADIDDDGLPDLAVAVNNGALRVYRNQWPGAETARSLRVGLSGPAANPTGVGARITVEAAGVSQVREVHAGSGYLSQDAPTQFFGLADADTPVTVRVRWQDGHESVVEGVAPGSAVEVKPTP